MQLCGDPFGQKIQNCCSTLNHSGHINIIEDTQFILEYLKNNARRFKIYTHLYVYSLPGNSKLEMH